MIFDTYYRMRAKGTSWAGTSLISIIISQMKDYYISVDQDRYATSVVEKKLDNATIKASTEFYKTNFHLI